MALIEREPLLAAYYAAHKGPPGGARKLIEEAPVVTPKEQEPVEPIENAGFYYCGACRYAFTSVRQKFCSDCGRAVKWNG